MNVIETYNLTKRFGNKTILNDLNFVVEKGDFFGLIGQNGAGKTTLINTLLGLYHVSGGTFEILGYKKRMLDNVKKELGIMPDVSNLYEDMNAAEFLKYMACLKGIKISKNEVGILLERVGLNVGKIKIKNYSFGMKKKICIAQALLGKPRLIFLDEPTSGVDPESILKIQDLFKDLNKEGSSIFITSHNLQEIEKLCNKVAILKNGSFKVNGNLEDIVNAYNKSRVRIKYSIKEENKGRLSKLLEEYTVEYLADNVIEVQLVQEYDVADLVKKLVDNEMHIHSVIPDKATLEEIFLS